MQYGWTAGDCEENARARATWAFNAGPKLQE